MKREGVTVRSTWSSPWQVLMAEHLVNSYALRWWRGPVGLYLWLGGYVWARALRAHPGCSTTERISLRRQYVDTLLSFIIEDDVSLARWQHAGSR